MAINGKKFEIADKNTETFTALCQQLGGLIGSSADLENICVSSKIKMGAKYKPVRHTTKSNITEQQRKDVNYGLMPSELNIFDVAYAGTGYTLYKIVGDISSWEYQKPRGGMSELNRIRDFDGYNHSAAAPLSIDSNIDLNINQDIAVITPNYKYDVSSINNSGSYGDIDIMLTELNFKVLNDQIENIGQSSVYTWRVAIAIPVTLPGYGGGTYSGYIIVSSEKPLQSIPSSAQSDVAEFTKYKINLAPISNWLKMSARRTKVNTFECIPFLAYDLKYDATNLFYWGGTIQQKALPFPKGEKFNLTVTGFPYEVKFSIKSYTLKINGTTYTPTGVVNSGKFYYIFQNVPKKVTSVQITAQIGIVTGFGRMYNWELGLGGYFSATPEIVNDANQEWVDQEKSYTFTADDTAAPSMWTAAATTGSMSYLDAPIIMRYTNSMLVGTQNVVNPELYFARIVFAQ